MTRGEDRKEANPEKIFEGGKIQGISKVEKEMGRVWNLR